MPSTPAREIPNVDFRLIPEELQGSWVVVRVGETQELLGSGATARQALAASRTDPSDITAILAQVPVAEVVTYVNKAASD